MRRKISALLAVLLCSLGAALTAACNSAPIAGGQNPDEQPDNGMNAVCPDFEVEILGEYEDDEGPEIYCPVNTRGKITVLNFWGVWIEDSLTELPAFYEVAQQNADTVALVAIHSAEYTVPSKDDEDELTVYESIVEKGWDKWNVTFAQDAEQKNGLSAYDLLGGLGTYPMTVILNEEGLISYKRMGITSAEQLQAMIGTLL